MGDPICKSYEKVVIKEVDRLIMDLSKVLDFIANFVLFIVTY